MTPRARRHAEVTGAYLRRHPLPALDRDSDKESRGRVLVVGGSTQVPGAILLAGVAALRAGAGKLQLATVRDVAPHLALAVPESLVVALPRNRDGEIGGKPAMAALRAHARGADAVLLGPGMTVGATARGALAGLLPHLGDETTLVLDGAAVVAVRATPKCLTPLDGRAILTPHAGETASLLGVDKRVVEADPPGIARRAALEFNAVVALKGAKSWIAAPDGTLLRYDGGSVGLGTSGSGDTLAGIVAGLAARGAAPIVAAMWGVWAHGAAGRALARRMGAVGFLARELLAEVPRLIAGRYAR